MTNAETTVKQDEPVAMTYGEFSDAPVTELCRESTKLAMTFALMATCYSFSLKGSCKAFDKACDHGIMFW